MSPRRTFKGFAAAFAYLFGQTADDSTAQEKSAVLESQTPKEDLRSSTNKERPTTRHSPAPIPSHPEAHTFKTMLEEEWANDGFQDSETHEKQPLSPEMSVHRLSLHHKFRGILNHLGYYYGIRTVKDLMGLERSGLLELPIITEESLTAFEDAISQHLGNSFAFSQGDWDDTPTGDDRPSGRYFNNRESSILAATSINALGLPRELVAKLRSNQVHTVKQLALISRRRLYSDYGVSLSDSFFIETLISELIGERFLFSELDGFPPVFIDNPRPAAAGPEDSSVLSLEEAKESTTSNAIAIKHSNKKTKLIEPMTFEELLGVALRKLPKTSNLSLEQIRQIYESAIQQLDFLDNEQPPFNVALARKWLKSNQGFVYVNDSDIRQVNDDEPRLRRLVTTIDSIALANTEYAVSFFFKELPKQMRDLGIGSPEVLEQYLRILFRNDSEVSFTEDLMIGFGAVDRTKQLERIASRKHLTTREAIAREYQWSYGVPVSTVLEWMNECFGNKEPAATPSVSSQPSTAVSIPTPRSTKKKSSATAERLDKFFKEQLQGPCCDPDLIKARFKHEFPARKRYPLNRDYLQELGYYKDANLLFEIGIVPDDYFGDLIDTNDLFSKGDKGFETKVFAHPAFKAELKRRLKHLTVLEYEKDKFISARRLEQFSGVTHDDLTSYVNAICDTIPKGEPFTIKSLANDYRFTHPVELLRDEMGLDDYFFESIIDLSYRTNTCSVNHTRVFICSEIDFAAPDFFRLVIEKEGPHEVDEFLYLLEDKYGISCPRTLFWPTIARSGLYYDDITDAIYVSKDQWKEVVKNELAR